MLDSENEEKISKNRQVDTFAAIKVDRVVVRSHHLILGTTMLPILKKPIWLLYDDPVHFYGRKRDNFEFFK